ncbi:MAG: hypothetical protein ACOH5I_06465 [Oligoflexus sp.]
MFRMPLHRLIGYLVSSLFTAGLAFATVPDWANHSELTHAPEARHTCNLVSCPRSADYELALEKEYWRHIQHEDIAGMQEWINKTTYYTTHWSHRQEYLKQKGRLWMLVAGGHTLLFNQYDLHSLVPVINNLRQGEILAVLKGSSQAFKQTPALYHLAESVHWAIKANQQLPDSRNAQTFLLGIGAFAQAALPPVLGVTGRQAMMNTFYGPSCQDFPQWLQSLLGDVCAELGLIGPDSNAHRRCVDQDSCLEVGAGTEGLFAGALTQVMMHDPHMVASALDMMGDGPGSDQVALCDNYWCPFNNPNDPAANLPEATSIAPFKRIGGLMAIAEGYGKHGELAKMDRVLKEAYREAERLNWPFIDLLEDVDVSLHGGDAERDIPDILAAWANPEPTNDFMGEMQLPLPVSVGARSCAGCHFGGVMNEEVRYD